MTIVPTGNYVADEYGFPAINRPGYDCIMGVVGVADDGSAVTIGKIPRGAILLPPRINVAVAFDDTGTDLLDIGNTGDDNAYADNLDISSAGQILTGMIATAYDGTPISAEITVTATYTGANSDGSNGSALIEFPFFRTG